jgi:small conductance mechanosensitive channel
MQDWEEVLHILSTQTDAWFRTAVKMVPNLVVAVIVLLFFVLLAGACRKIFYRLFGRLSYNRSVSEILSRGVYVFTILIGLFVALGVMNLEKTVTSLLAGAGVIGIALGFAFQEIASNFIAGILIAFTRPFQLGDIVEIENYVGVINRIDIRTTSLMTFDQLEVLLPNKDLFTKALTNYTTTPKRKVDFTCGVSYGEDLRHVKEVVLEALSGLPHRTKDDSVEVYFTAFGDSSITFVASVWIVYPGSGNFLKTVDEGIIRIKEAFDREGIVIPFPVRTMDFGIKGGVSLKEQLSPKDL